ncbi:RHS repeat-associated core domain-containing protein [Sorangium sp. So ce269]
MARTAPVPNIPAIPGMNPGVFVMGGGGGAGGKGGRGGNGQGDGQGAGGQNGGQNADGGGKGGNACGQGTGAAACTNPRHGGNGGTAAGDPVDIVTGRVFTVPAVDLGLPGPLPLVLRRQYSSTARERDLGLGFGWSHSLAWAIVPSRRRVDILQDDGTVLEAPLPAVGESRRLFGGVSLRAARSGFALSLEGGVTLLFHEQDALDDVYRLSSMVDRNGNLIRLAYDGPELLTVTDSAGRVVRCVRDASRRIARFEVKTATAPNGWHAFHRYEYDPVGQLVARLPAEGARELFRHDAAGNLRLGGETHELGPGGKTLRLGGRAYHHDEGGRLVAKEAQGGGRWTYAYDARGLLKSVRDPAGQVTEFDYDALYRRVEKRVRAADGSARRVQFVWDGEQILHELSRGAQQGAASGAEVRTYCFLDGSPAPLGEIDPSGRRRFYVHAPNGFPELVISAAGAIEAAQPHRAFGGVDGEGATPLRFPGQYADRETGLYYNRFRYYDPEIGAYISADPIEISRSPRLYGYAENSPPNVVDLDGLQPMTTTIRPSNATGRSAAGRDRNNPAEVHPTVWNNMANQVQVQSPNGTTNMEFPQATRHPANCSEPAALSQHLFDYEERNNLPRGTCGSANDPNNNHLRSALREVDSIESTQDDGGARNACPNCGVLIRNLQNQANQGRPEGEPPVDLVNRVRPGIDQPSQRYQDAVAAGNPQRSAVEAMQNPNAPGNMAVRPPPNWRPRGTRR